MLTRRNPPRVEPTPPSLEEELTQKVREEFPNETVREYAPPLHPDRISDTTRIMKDAISKVIEDAITGVDTRVSEIEAKAADTRKAATLFAELVRNAADQLNKQIEVIMAQVDDVNVKMRESPFGPLPRITQGGPMTPAEVSQELTQAAQNKVNKAAEAMRDNPPPPVENHDD